MHHFRWLYMVGTTAGNGKKKLIEESENNQHPNQSKKTDKFLIDINQYLTDTCNQYYI